MLKAIFFASFEIIEKQEQESQNKGSLLALQGAIYISPRYSFSVLRLICGLLESKIGLFHL